MVELAIALIGLLIATIPIIFDFPRSQVDYDFVTPLLQMAWFMGILGLTTGTIIGRII